MNNKLSVLIVDDDADFLLATRDSIQSYFNIVLTASCVADARIILHEMSDQIDLILCDFKMPGEDGLALQQYVTEKYPNIAFVVLTAFPDDPKIIHSQTKHNTHVVTKSSQMNELIKGFIKKL